MTGTTKIEWTHILEHDGSTWNPLRARNTLTGKSGHFCIKFDPGCDNCYAEDINMYSKGGNGLPYRLDAKQHARFYVSGRDDNNKGQTSIEWPLRTRPSRGIFTGSMTDWCGEWLETDDMQLVLGTMMLAQHHIFLPCTKRDARMHNMILDITDPKVHGIRVPEGDIWNEAILRARGNLHKWGDNGSPFVITIANNDYDALVPWPPRNIIFGITIATQRAAETKLRCFQQLKNLLPQIRFFISHEPALEVVDWESMGYAGLVDWIIVGGESGQGARLLPEKALTDTIAFGEKFNIPIFVKQMGSVYANIMYLDEKGTNVPPPYNVRQFPEVEGYYKPWLKRSHGSPAGSEAIPLL